MNARAYIASAAFVLALFWIGRVFVLLGWWIS